MSAADLELARRVREALPPVGEAPPGVDLWPRLERRLDASRSGPGRLDWLLAGLVAGLLAWFPEVVLLVLYHL